MSIDGPPVRERSRDNRAPITSFDPARIEYTWSTDRSAFVHQYQRDLQLIVVWPTGREREHEILDHVYATLPVVAQYEVTWSPGRLVTNLERLYGRPLTGRFGKHREVGQGPFLLLVVEDREPRYGYLPNVSGLVELTNLNIAALKRTVRAIAGGYRVHSSNNLTEFFRDASVLLGEKRLEDLITGPRSTVWQFLDEDPPGADGWDDLGHLFGVLRRSAAYVVLRNFDTLPMTVDDDDEIDVLCRRPVDLAALANAVKERPGPIGARYACTVGGRTVHLDTRYVGDGYLDARWQQDILARRVWHADLVAVPRPDDHFFSLLYHAKIQKPAVKPAYPARLRALAAEIGLEDRGDVTTDAAAGALLDGYLSAHGYGIPRPADRGVHRNDAFLATLTLTDPEPTALRTAADSLWQSARRSPAARLLGRSRILRGGYRRARAFVAH